MGESTCGSRWLWSRVQGLKATMMMIIAQVISAGINILYIFVGNDGMNLSILMTYRFLCASIVVAPLALLVERNKRPKLTWTILLQAALCALFGGPMALIMYAESVILTSPTLAAAFSNLIPPFTFILAVLFRLESVNLGQMGGKAKVIGTLMGVGGAMLLTFYKGPSINIWSTHFHLLPKRVQPRVGDVASTHQNSFNDHIIGSVLSLAAILSMSLSLIIQAKMSERYPCDYSSTALISMIGFIQSFIFAICNERRWSQWKLGWNIRLLTVLYLGVLASGLTFTFIMSCVRVQGPLFVSSFNPLVVVLVAIAGSLVLGEQLHVGSVLGSTIIIAGLYMVLWGKSKDIKRPPKFLSSTNSELLEIRKEDTSTIITTSTNILGTSYTAPTISSKEDEDHELQVKSEMGKHKDQEIDEAKN
ncbi:WAT1-related protein At1g68170-like [Cynara cardunculus var. scolymus]|uniref:WAT1-related protein At1g68170-like n=1 Tax=Cynara cardunculus var. scolymus TaxID=59895 RepID=UPI000D629780|nr:WAT1-related protein At1g68170-like [Cynara cardunculus var. scolymus]